MELGGGGQRFLERCAKKGTLERHLCIAGHRDHGDRHGDPKRENGRDVEEDAPERSRKIETQIQSQGEREMGSQIETYRRILRVRQIHRDP